MGSGYTQNITEYITECMYLQCATLLLSFSKILVTLLLHLPLRLFARLRSLLWRKRNNTFSNGISGVAEVVVPPRGPVYLVFFHVFSFFSTKNCALQIIFQWQLYSTGFIWLRCSKTDLLQGQALLAGGGNQLMQGAFLPKCKIFNLQWYLALKERIGQRKQIKNDMRLEGSKVKL